MIDYTPLGEEEQDRYAATVAARAFIYCALCPLFFSGSISKNALFELVRKWVARVCNVFSKAVLSFKNQNDFHFSFKVKKKQIWKVSSMKGRHLHLCSDTEVFFWCQQTESFILKVARFCLSFIIPLCSTTKQEEQILFLYNLGLLGKDWDILSGFEVNVWLSLTLAAVLRTERTLGVFKCLNDDSHKLEKAFLSYAHCCSTRITNHGRLSF